MDSEHWALNHPLSVVGVDSFDPARSCACGYYSSHQSPNTGFPRSCCGGTARLSILSSQWLLCIHISTKHKAFLKQLSRKRASSPTRNLLAFFLNFWVFPNQNHLEQLPLCNGLTTSTKATNLSILWRSWMVDAIWMKLVRASFLMPKYLKQKGVYMYICTYIYICITICNHTSSHIIMSNHT